jgi:hypothetical protein
MHGNFSLFTFSLRNLQRKFSAWLGREDSNLQMGDPKSPDLPFVDAPTKKIHT